MGIKYLHYNFDEYNSRPFYLTYIIRQTYPGYNIYLSVNRVHSHLGAIVTHAGVVMVIEVLV